MSVHPSVSTSATSEYSSKALIDENWKPEGALQASECNVDFIDLIGVTGPPSMLVFMWGRYKDQNAKADHDPEIITAFIKSATCLGRRCPEVMFPLVREIAESEAIDDSGLHLLGLLAAEIGLADVVRSVFYRCKGKKMRGSYYHSVLKTATQCCTEVDMPFALEVCDEMHRQDVPHTSPSLRSLLYGLARMPKIPLEIALNIMDFRLRVNHDVEGCLLNAFFSLIEILPGDQTKRAGEYLSQLNPMLIHKPISAVLSEPQPSHKEGCHSPNVQLHYYLTDLLSVQFDPATVQIPQNTYVTFLYSSVRALCEKLFSCGKEHPLARKASALETLIELHKEQKNVVVIPLAVELCIRLPNEPAVYTPHAKIISFIRGISLRKASNVSVQIVTADPALIRQAGELGIPTIPTLPTKATPAPGTKGVSK